jgi:hypothetical protein
MQVIYTVNSNVMSGFQEFHSVLKHISVILAINETKDHFDFITAHRFF